MTQPFTLLLVHHAHTDVGYTEAQHRIERWHVDFIRQALRTLARWPEFRWTCETWWAVERFLDEATSDEVDAFAEHVRARRIGLSASYLNFSELLDAPVLRAVTARAGRAAAAWGAEVRCALTADVNGFGWGFAQALLEAGADNLFTCVHTHHGTVPLGRTQVPFGWRAPDGRRVLVWNGEHYHLGNELGLMPGASSSYLIKDECGAATIFGDHRKVAALRIPRYVQALRDAGYPFDFAPVMASGLRTDNGPPNPAVLDAVGWWNETQAADTGIEVRLAVLEDVFDAVRASDVEIPEYEGDWPDWWSDGPASRPAAVRLFRKAQRDVDWLDALSASGLEDGALPDRAAVETDLALFAEHTFSHSDSVAAPWHDLVQTIDLLKEGHLARAVSAIGRGMEDARLRLGGAVLRPALPLHYRVVQPFPAHLDDLARLPVGHHEFEELGLGSGFDVRDLESGALLPSELVHVPRGCEILVPLSFAGAGERWLEIVPSPNGRRVATETARDGLLETEHVRVRWAPPHGVVEMVDRATGRSLVRADAPHAAFQPVHDVTPVAHPSQVCTVRGRMGLNRKGPDAIVSAGETSGRARGCEGEVLVTATLDYELAGTRLCEVELRAHVHAPRLDVSVRLHKESLWAPENLYVSLPFSAGERALVLLAKAGGAARPRVHQIPGTPTDFYAVQSGWQSTSPGLDVSVAMPDHHLLQLGPLAYGERLLAGDPRLDDDPAHPYGWLMTNFWETNFAADLGGFHEFRYRLAWGPGASRTNELVRGLETIRLGRRRR